MSGMRHDGINTSIRTAGSALSATTSTFTSAPPMDAGRAAAKVQAVTRGKKTRSEISMSPPVVSSSQPANRSPSSPDKLGNSSSRSSRASSPTSILRGERILIQHESAQTDLSGDTVEAARSHMAIVVAAANDAVAITAAEAAKDVAEVMAIVHAEKHAREEIERHCNELVRKCEEDIANAHSTSSQAEREIEAVRSHCEQELAAMGARLREALEITAQALAAKRIAEDSATEARLAEAAARKAEAEAIAVADAARRSEAAMVGQAIGAREEARIESERARKAEAEARWEALQQRAMARESGEAHLIAVKEAEVTAKEAELQRAARLEAEKLVQKTADEVLEAKRAAEAAQRQAGAREALEQLDKERRMSALAAERQANMERELAHGTLSARLQETQRELAYRRQADHIEVTLPEQVRRIEARATEVEDRARAHEASIANLLHLVDVGSAEVERRVAVEQHRIRMEAGRQSRSRARGTLTPSSSRSTSPTAQGSSQTPSPRTNQPQPTSLRTSSPEGSPTTGAASTLRRLAGSARGSDGRVSWATAQSSVQSPEWKQAWKYGGK